jgi:3-hydroxyacyl-CoA dehydrogenase
VTELHSERIAIVGAGSIGAAWTIVFAMTGFRVNLQDTECVPEHLDLKRRLFADLDRLAAPAAILASSSSFLSASAFAGDLAGRARCLVVHPGNPPYLLRVAELVPAPFTDAGVIERTVVILTSAGMAPVRLQREIDGFVFNRLQGALLREAYCLVRDGLASVADIDRIVRDGLGLRWSVIGPFETADLNTRGGIAQHAQRMGPAYQRMGRERGQDDPWTGDLVARVVAERRAILPLEEWEERVAWRDRALMALLRCRRGDVALEDLDSRR